MIDMPLLHKCACQFRSGIHQDKHSAVRNYLHEYLCKVSCFCKGPLVEVLLPSQLELLTTYVNVVASTQKTKKFNHFYHGRYGYLIIIEFQYFYTEFIK